MYLSTSFPLIPILSTGQALSLSNRMSGSLSAAERTLKWFDKLTMSGQRAIFATGVVMTHTCRE